MKKFLAYLLCSLVLCTSVLAEFDDAVTPDAVTFDTDSSGEVVENVETQAPLEEIDSLVDDVSSLVDETVPADSIDTLPAEVSPGGNTVYVVTQPAIDGDSDVSYSPVSIDDPDVVITDISLASVSPITPSSTSGLKAALLGILGNYDPVVVEYEYSSGNGYTNYLREIQPDYVWLCSAALLALVIYCLFKLGGGLLRG